MKSKPIVIALTCVGGRYSALMIDALRKGLGQKCVIVGIDKNPEVLNQAFCDFFYAIASPSEESTYIETLISINNKHKIDVLLPCSEPECKIISKHLEVFAKRGIVVAIQKNDFVDIYTDKLKFFKFVNSKKLASIPAFEINTIQDLENSLVHLGYPKKKVVLKSRSGTGSRGVIVLDSKITKFHNYLEDRLCGTADLLAVKNKVSTEKDFFFGNLAMPYYVGKTFDVDCVSNNGKLVSYACRERVYKNEFSPINEGCILRDNKDIISFLEKFCTETQLHGCVDFDISWSEESGAIPLDVSMRMSGSIGCTLPLGLNLPADLVSTLLNLDLPKRTSDVLYNQLIIPSYQFFITKKSPYET